MFSTSCFFRLISINISSLVCMCMTVVSSAVFGDVCCVGVQDEQGDSGSFVDVLSSLIQIPRGDTNILYYAGSSDGKAFVIHITSAGEHKWKLQKANLDQDIIMPYTEDRDKWILLKKSGEDRLRHWNWKLEIIDFIQRLPRNSAIVSSNSSWFQVADKNSQGSNILWAVDSFVVDSTLCEKLKCGDKICTARLFDGQTVERQRILSEAYKKNVKITGRKIVARELKYACWNSAKIVHVEGPSTETALCIDSEIVAPLKFYWDCLCDELLPFDEEFAISAYKKRAEEFQK